MALLTPNHFRQAFSSYKGLSGQNQGVDALYHQLQASCPEALDENAAWLELFRTNPESQPPAGEITNTYEGIRAAAANAGAKFPDCVAAQWALESGYGRHTSGKNNFFGIKGPGTSCKTWEDYGSGPVNVVDSFRDFASIQDCVAWLVDRWYKDFRGYQGVNRASSREDCARLLKAEGYATDPAYVQKLISIMHSH